MTKTQRKCLHRKRVELPQDCSTGCFTGYTNMALVSLFRKWKCPVTPKPRPLNVVVVNKIIVLVLVIKARQHSSYKKNIISSASSKMARVTEPTNWLHFNGIVLQVFLLLLTNIKVPISPKFLFSYLILYLTQWTSAKEKFDLDTMQYFLEVLKTFKFAAILVLHSHQSSLLFEWVVT